MNDKVFEQAAESFFKPMNDFLALNVETLDTLRAKNTDLVNEMMAESIEYATGMAQPTLDMESLMATQKSYWEGVSTKLSDNAQENYELLSSVQGKFSELLSSSLESVNFTNASAPSVAAEKSVKPAGKKTTAKKATKITKASPKVKSAETADEA